MEDATRSLSPINVEEQAFQMIEFFAALGWQKLGLQPDMMTGKTEQDLPQAKLAIDLTAALADVVIPKLPDDDQRTLRNLVTDLRVNYVQRAGGS
ncbi:MAG: DUF1844 domain-containing protein [Fimbriimonadaceae bacterium]|jgi:hypothetical protein|nr:DUF1844 domain-containing protein [Fimbriimonadaceae bacterium]